MAKLDFNFWAFDYDRRITVMADTLATAEAALDAKSAEIAAVRDKHEQDVSDGIVGDDTEYDEDTGAVMWSRSWGYDQDLEVINEGLVALRKAFVVALYHHWEKTVQKWADIKSNAKHAKLYKAVRDKGVTPPDRLEHVYHLNNVLKHNSLKNGPALLKEWPELFVLNDMIQKRLDAGKTDIAWSDNVSISADRMKEIFDVMRASGPT